MSTTNVCTFINFVFGIISHSLSYLVASVAARQSAAFSAQITDAPLCFCSAFMAVIRKCKAVIEEAT